MTLANQRKLPFKSYTIMNNDLIAHFSCPDVYRLYVLSLTTDRELKTDTTLEQLANFVGESVHNLRGGIRSKSFPDKLRESSFVDVVTVDGKSYSNGNRITRNIYTFKEPIPTQYRRITRGLFDIELPTKLKGYIIKLFSITNPHSYIIEKTINEIEKLLRMDKKTIKKYNEELEELNFLVKDGKK
jgi:hypothetical protein